MKIITPKWERSFLPDIDGGGSYFKMNFIDWDCSNQFLIYQFEGWERGGTVYLDLLNGTDYHFDDPVNFDVKTSKNIYKYITKFYWNDKKSFFISPYSSGIT